MQAVETLLNTLPDSLAMALVLFVFLYLVYLGLATVAFLFLRETHGFIKLALLPFTASFFVVQQLFACAADLLSEPKSDTTELGQHPTSVTKENDAEYGPLLKTPDFNRAASDPNYAVKHGLGGYNDTFWD